MKKLITCMIGVSVAFASMAQAPVRTEAREVRPHDRVIVDLEQPSFYKHNPANMAPEALEARSGRGAVEFIPIGTAYNLFTTLLAGQNQVSYHPDINSVAFVHRQNSGTPGGSGGLSFDISTDGGATWTTNVILSLDYNAGAAGVITGNRYPSGSLWNPAGNTDPANAYFVAHGPSLTSVTGSWGATHQMSADFAGGSNYEEYYSEGGLSNDYFPYAINWYEDGSLWDMKEQLTGDTVYVNKFEFDGVSAFNRTSTMVVPDWEIVNSGGEAIAGSGGTWCVNFDASGTTGYALATGTLTSSPQKSVQPQILKTTDGGGTWSWLPGYDWSTNTTMQEWVVAQDGGTGDIVPYFTEIDGTVGSDGRLHMFAEVLSSFSGNYLDSMYFIYADYRVYMHLSTSDGADWEVETLGYSLLPEGEFGSTPVSVTQNPQISRTPDGSKLFFAWNESDSLIFTDHSAPDLFVLGYDIASGEYTNPVNITDGTDYTYSAYYPTMAPVSMDNGAGEYELPIVFSVPGADDVSPPQFYYAKGIIFTDDDFGAEPAAIANFTFSVSGATATFTNSSSNATSYSWNFGDGSGTSPLESPVYTYTASGTYNVCLTASNATSSDETCKNVTATVVGIEDLLLDAALNIYPTPANEMMNINLNGNFSNVSVEIFNLLGESVMSPISLNGGSATVNVAGLAEGNYIVKLTSDNGYAVRQITIAR